MYRQERPQRLGDDDDDDGITLIRPAATRRAEGQDGAEGQDAPTPRTRTPALAIPQINLEPFNEETIAAAIDNALDGRYLDYLVDKFRRRYIASPQHADVRGLPRFFVTTLLTRLMAKPPNEGAPRIVDIINTPPAIFLPIIDELIAPIRDLIVQFHDVVYNHDFANQANLVLYAPNQDVERRIREFVTWVDQEAERKAVEMDTVHAAFQQRLAQPANTELTNGILRAYITTLEIARSLQLDTTNRKCNIINRVLARLEDYVLKKKLQKRYGMLCTSESQAFGRRRRESSNKKKNLSVHLYHHAHHYF